MIVKADILWVCLKFVPRQKSNNKNKQIGRKGVENRNMVVPIVFSVIFIMKFNFVREVSASGTEHNVIQVSLHCLQGCIGTQVNQGPTEIALTFLNVDDIDAEGGLVCFHFLYAFCT